MVDTISKERRSWNMSRIRGRDTKPEKHLRSLLHRAGFRFRLHDRELPGRPDIVLRKYKAAIFVHGCFWHRHPDCSKTTMPSTRKEFWQSKFEGTVERDRRAQSELAKMGWRSITVWECELEENPEKVIADVSFRLKKCR